MNFFEKVLVPLIICALAPFAVAADRSIENHPGFVDFSQLTAIANVEPKVEVSLKAPLLNMMTNLIRTEDEQAAEFMSKLLRVTVNVFESGAINIDEISASMNQTAEELDAKGWDRVVRVREDGDHVDIYFRLSEDGLRIQGVAIMVAEPSEIVLVNIVGDISTEDISALGRRFDIPELSDIEID
ncbi:MAG: hypothetical protein ACI9E4_000024 [Pseudohongiellaceae bacterium]|jgi:hypothetical protein